MEFRRVLFRSDPPREGYDHRQELIQGPQPDQLGIIQMSRDNVLVRGHCTTLSRVHCHLSRCMGAGLVAIAVLLVAQPARADQTIMASDSAQVDCQASAKDLTRISLVEDEFASVSKISTGNPIDDFSVE